ncbi:hypothetical protein ACP70R_004281 [Stipagrostis hirtigluma subsp. patula]
MAESKQEEQARRARALAEKCFLAGNVYSAKRWMQSALRLAPSLRGNAQAAAAYDVHAAAARTHLGATDWYAVLGLPHPGSSGAAAAGLTHEAIKRQHRSLCLLVHPDKNPSAAADGAFKLVQAAWDALSARHPPGSTSAAAPPPSPAQAPPTKPPDPQPQPRPRPQAAQMPRRRAAASTPGGYTGAREQQRWRRVSPPPTSRRSPSPPAGKCPACGARTTNGKRSFRCMSCHWSPVDVRQYDDDDYDYEDYRDDGSNWDEYDY